MSTLPAQQKSLFLLSKQGTFSVRINEIPKPGPNDLLVKVEVAALNPRDERIQADGSLIKNFPAVLGADASGIVAAVGTLVANIGVGERVAIQSVARTFVSGTFQQYLLTPAALAITFPDNLSFDEAATLPVCLGTAAITLYNKHHDASSFKLVAPWEEGGRGAYAGKPVVVLGGASSVGQYVIQLLRLSGFSPIITTASIRNVGLVKSLGATHIIERSVPDDVLRSEVHKIAGGTPEFVYDAISIKSTQNLAYDLVAHGGSVVLVQPEDIDSKRKECKQANVNVSAGEFGLPRNVEFGEAFVKALPELLEDGSVKPNIPEVLPGGLDAIVGGLKRLRAGDVSARKLVVHPHETP
ncbi:GroES-like protein [Trametes maxima]|nr:GroES-like protein [Trametes maxima]